ncbi:RNA polymerase sigma factor [bacterium]|nr:MAG: RNA polymerase sigma factor [bacterium]
MDRKERFVLLLREAGDKAYNFAFQLAGNDADARDLVQEAAVRAFENMARYDSARPFDTWMLTILRNVFLDWRRRARLRAAEPLDAGEGGLAEFLAGPDLDPAETALRGESAADVQRALAALPEHYRAAVVLSDMEGLRYEDIAEVLDVPVGTVRSRIHMGRRLLKKILAETRGGAYGTA